jgi:regulator of replication initiation timing
MSPEITDLQFEMMDSKGQTWMVTIESVKQTLGICALEDKVSVLDSFTSERIDRLWEAINDLRANVVDQLMPQAQLTLINTFRLNKQLDTRQVHKFIEAEESQCKRWALHEAFESLQNDGTLIGQSQGKGKPRLWRLVKDPLALVPARRTK